MSKTNPSLYEVLGEIASSKQPIEEGDIFQAFQNILREKHRALRVLQEEKERASFSEEEAHQPQPLDEYTPTEADKLQIKHEGVQLGCLLVQKTKGETQLEVTRWLQTANSWEAWRQLNLQSKWSIHFKLLASLMNISFDDQPASCLQQFNAWKEQVVGYQQLVGEQLPDFIKLLAVVNGLKGSVRNLVLLNLDSPSSFGDLDSLLARYVDIHDQHESSLGSLCDRACRDKPESIGKGNDTESNPSFEQQLEEGGKRKEGKGKGKSKPNKGKGEANPPQPPAYKGKGKHAQPPTRKKWCIICWKTEHRTQACWYSSQQHQQQHQQQQAWQRPSKPRRCTEEASRKRSQPRVYNIDQQTAYTRLIPDTQPMLSFEHRSQASTQSAYTTTTYTIAQLDSFENASSTTELWGIMVDRCSH